MAKKVDVITMGCSKNLVDSERVVRMLSDAGFKASHNADTLTGSIAIVNTCGFIGDAKEESIDMILKCCQAKSEGKLEKVYVMGCLSERYKDALPAEIPEVDAWYGKFDWDGIISSLRKDAFPSPSRPWERTLSTPPHTAYLKIAEGCNRFCSFCAIPLITGRFRSRPEEDILDEVKSLTAKGVKEFNIIAQDLSSYGLDIYGKQTLASLIDNMAGIPGVEWIRLHYFYPAQFPYDILDVMNRHENVCKYIDIALQHCPDKVLANMRRHITGEETRLLLDTIRRKVPGIHIRTTLMVGFPGEGEAEFEELKNFIREQRFERMGAFAYCEEEDTYGARNFTDDIPDEVKQSRLDELMAIQEEIALESNLGKVGQTLKVLVERESDGHYIGRTQWDSPEVDPEVLITKNITLSPGEFAEVTVTEALPFELIGHPTNKH